MKLPREAPTLTKLCIKSIALNINLWCQGVEEFHLERCRYLLTAFDEYTLPDHLALQILNALALRKKLTLSNFVMFLNSSLVQLDLHECGGYITDHFIRQVAKRAQRIRRLNLATCFKITNPAVLDLARRLRCLQSVDLTGCNKLQDSALEAIAENTGITSLRLGAVTKLGDSALLRVAARLAGLEELDLTHCPRITDRSATQLFDRCPQLKTLSLGGCWEVSDTSFSRIKLQVNLEHLDVAVSSIGNAGLQALKGTCKKLKYLNLEGCANITDEAFLDDTPFGEHLETLNLAGCSNITARGIIGLFLDQISAPESLRTLHLPQTLTDGAFIFITNQLRHVVSLNIESCTELTEKAFKSYPLIALDEVRATPRRQRAADINKMSEDIDSGEIPGDLCFPLMPRLKKLNCKGCESLSDVALACLAGVGDEEKHEVALEELILEGCERVSDDGLHHLRQCANLRVLDLSKCLNVTHLGVEDLLQGKQPDNDDEQQPEPSNHTTKKKKNAKGKKVEEQPRLMVDEEGELPWVLVGAKAGQALAAQAAGQRRKRNKNRRKRKGGGAHHRTSITQLKIGGCTQISRIEWEEAKQHFPSVAIAWH